MDCGIGPTARYAALAGCFEPYPELRIQNDTRDFCVCSLIPNWSTMLQQVAAARHGGQM